MPINKRHPVRQPDGVFAGLAAVSVLAVVLVLVAVLILIAVLVLVLVLVGLVLVILIRLVLVVHSIASAFSVFGIAVIIACPVFYDLSFARKKILASRPQRMAAVIPPAVAFRPPLRIPRKPSS